MDWNPADPDATRVYYDLSSWSIDHRAELAAEFADAEIPHTWADTELMIPEEFEDQADLLIEVVENRLGITSDVNDPDAKREDAGHGPEAILLPADAPTTEYALDEWPEQDVVAVTHALTGAEIPFRWEGRLLLVATRDEAVVDSLLDEIETGEYLDVDPEGDAPEADGPPEERLPVETLTTFFLAGERLQRDPLDANGLEQLLAATAVADPERPPYGVQPRLWEQTCALAERIADALGAEEGPSEDEAMAAATELHDLLRPYV